MSDVLLDVRYGWRSLRHKPGFTLVAALTLALGIGANTSMFSVAYGVLVRPLPYPDSDRLVQLAQTFRGSRGILGVTYSQFQFFQEHNRVFGQLAAATPVGFNVFDDAVAERVSGLRVSRDYFKVLGVSPELGRDFLPDDDQAGGPAVAILSHGLWMSRFGGEPGRVGGTILIDGTPHTVVGVMPAGFVSFDGVELWSTLAPVRRTIGSGQNLSVIGRLRPGLSYARAQSDMALTTSAFRTEFADIVSPEMGVALAPYRDLLVNDVERPVTILFGAIGLVLLIACANVASLLLGRAAGRSREIGVRMALGATRWRLTRQLLIESVLLAMIGGGLGLIAAQWGLRAILALVPASLPRAQDIGLDGWALAFTLGLSVATGLVFGLLPARQATSARVQDALKEGSGRVTGGRRARRVRGALIVAEVALSLVLLVGAGLLVRTFAHLVRTDPGFETNGLLTAELWLTGSRYDSAAAISTFYDRLIDRLRQEPGVARAAVVEAGIPLQRGGNMPFAIDGESQNAAAEYRTVTPDYLGVLGVPLEQGRMFTTADAASSEPVMIVNHTFASRYFGDEGALGHFVRIGGSGDPPRRIIGVAGDVKSFVGYPTRPGVFIPSAQTPAGFTRVFSSWFPVHVVLRATGDPGALREVLVRAIRGTDPLVPVGRIRTMEDVLAGSLVFQRFVMVLLTIFACLAVALAAVGMYGIVSMFAAERSREIGIRMALGALRGDVVRLVVRQGMILAGSGLVLGLATARVFAHVLDSQLFGVRSTDLVTFGGVPAILGLVALAACAVPAVRAARSDPVQVLRHE